MNDGTKHYSNGDITVVWKPTVCTRSTNCWKELNSVFNPRHRPWINMNGAWTDEIIAQVEKCPSGALSYFRNNESVGEINLKAKPEVNVEVKKNGPLLVHGSITVKQKDGSELDRERVTAFCRCGASANKPFCDGTHVKIGFKDE